jgi:hypothetical protein
MSSNRIILLKAIHIYQLPKQSMILPAVTLLRQMSHYQTKKLKDRFIADYMDLKSREIIKGLDRSIDTEWQEGKRRADSEDEDEWEVRARRSLAPPQETSKFQDPTSRE